MDTPDPVLGTLVDLHLVRESGQGPVSVLAGLDLELRRGEHLAVVGANGSGKSSLLRYLAGPDSPLTARTGLVFQDPDEQLVAVTVAEELQLGRSGIDVPTTLGTWGLEGCAGQDPRGLSAGQKQRLQLAVVLAGEPEVIMADEPSSLQDPRQAVWVKERLLAWRRDTGGTLVWATQRDDEVAVADRVLVLQAGRAIALTAPDALAGQPELAALLDPGYATGPAPIIAADGEPIALWQGVGCRFAGGGGFAAVDLTARAGERLGITGLNGCGKSTLLAAAAGLRQPDAGTVAIAGRRLYARGSQDLDHGLASLAPQFPEYLFTQATAAREIEVDTTLAARGAGAVLQELGLAPDLAGRNPHDLSGGEKRRLALALALLVPRPLILLDEPTAALDAPGRCAVAALVAKAAPQAAVVIASHDEEFLRACGCRVLVLEAGGLRAL